MRTLVTIPMLRNVRRQALTRPCYASDAVESESQSPAPHVGAQASPSAASCSAQARIDGLPMAADAQGRFRLNDDTIASLFLTVVLLCVDITYLWRHWQLLTRPHLIGAESELSASARHLIPFHAALAAFWILSLRKQAQQGQTDPPPAVRIISQAPTLHIRLLDSSPIDDALAALSSTSLLYVFLIDSVHEHPQAQYLLWGVGLVISAAVYGFSSLQLSSGQHDLIADRSADLLRVHLVVVPGRAFSMRLAELLAFTVSEEPAFDEAPAFFHVAILKSAGAPLRIYRTDSQAEAWHLAHWLARMLNVEFKQPKVTNL